MSRMIDPISRAQMRAAAHDATQPVREQATAGHEFLPYELQMEAPRGAQVHRLTVAGSYRSSVPIAFDFGTRTAYPVRVR